MWRVGGNYDGDSHALPARPGILHRRDNRGLHAGIETCGRDCSEGKPAAGLWWMGRGDGPLFLAMVHLLVVYFATTYVKTNGVPFPHFSLKLSVIQNAIVSLFYLPPAVGLLMASWLGRQWLGRRYGLREANMTFVLVWTLFFYCQVLGRSDIYHLLITQVPFFILSACLWAAALESEVAKAPFSVAATAALAGFLICAGPLFLEDGGLGQEASLARAGVRFQGAQEMAELVRRVQGYAAPDRSILCLPYQPMLYFICQRHNPTRWNYLWPGDQTAADHQTLVTEARNDPPAVVLITDEAELAQFAPLVLNYVHEDYSSAARIFGVSIYRPK